MFTEYYHRVFLSNMLAYRKPTFFTIGQALKILDADTRQNIRSGRLSKCFMLHASHIPAVVTMPIPVYSTLLPLQRWLMEFTFEASLTLTRLCSTNYASPLSPIASAPCVTSVLRSLPALAVQATSNRNWGACDENLSVQDCPTLMKYSKTFWGLPMTI